MTQTLDRNEITCESHPEATRRPTPDVPLDLTTESSELLASGRSGRKRHHRLINAGAVLLLPAALGGIGLAMFQASGDKAIKSAQALEQRDEAQKREIFAKKQLDEVIAERRVFEKERDEALARERAARRSEQDAKAVLAFLQDKLLLATGNPTSWDTDGLGKDATLREAVEAAEAKTTGAFGDRPLVEAAIREILGAAYLDMGEAERAVHQYQLALGLREAELGPDDPSSGDCRNQLAVAYRRARRHDDASRLFDVRPKKRKSE